MQRLLPSLITALAALLVAVSGNGPRLPLDDHEVFVARTAEEMLQRGSMLVPYFNGEPRAAKPPLAYWATMLVDRLGNRDNIISEWEARLPTIIGGVLWALAALALGTILCGRTIGFVGALLLIGGTGFLTYTHSARPELLYAMFCTAGLACFARSWSIDGAAIEVAAPSSAAARFAWPVLGWSMMGLAVLTKGPQMPLIMLAAWAIGMAAMGEGRLILRTLRPFSGVLILAAVSLWWFILMWTGVEGAGDRMERETLGRIFQIEGKPLTRIIDPYYFYRILVLLVPWVALYVAGLASPWIREIKLARGPRLLWWISVITIASLHLTLNRRWYYLLPILAPLNVLMACCSIAIGNALVERGRTGLWRILILIHIALCAGVLIYLWQVKPHPLQPSLTLVALMLAVAAAAGIALISRPRHRESPQRSMFIVALAGVALMTAAGRRASFWNIERFNRRDFALEVSRTVVPGASLIGNHHDWQQEQYYLHREIPSYEHPDALSHALRDAAARGETWLLTNSRKPLQATSGVELTQHLRLTVEQGEDVMLWRVHALR